LKGHFTRAGGWSTPVEDSFRSGLEVNIAKQLTDAGIQFRYEQDTISYIIPASNHTYNPDFILPNGIIVEGKGLFEIDDRKKHLFIKTQYPHLDIRFVFSNPNQKINKGSKTSYAMWCEKNGFQYAKKLIPVGWLKESHTDTTGLKPKKVKGEK
jgi:hypothetical protein